MIKSLVNVAAYVIKILVRCVCGALVAAPHTHLTIKMTYQRIMFYRLNNS